MQKNMNSRVENGKQVYYKFECNHCGECCIFLDVILVERDILDWIQKGRSDLLQYIQIQLESINYENFLKAEIEGKLEQLRIFILANHEYLGEDIKVEGDILIKFHNYLPNIGIRGILSPKNFEVILNGMKLGIKYILRCEANGYCIFFKKNRCLIHEVKPAICKQFPFETNGQLALNDWTLSICKGIKKMLP
ncbi:MAG TPA: YkgJ family cysteine cluster protein [Candidatus Deferrimicrobium sp.]|nr:YkgJ family cysteine cluster protein [Candidatus Deferrimicrobium sp.]